jgi:hypothetical protein
MINIEDDLIRRVAGLNGIREKSSPVKFGLETPVCRAISNAEPGGRNE